MGTIVAAFRQHRDQLTPAERQCAQICSVLAILAGLALLGVGAAGLRLKPTWATRSWTAPTIGAAGAVITLLATGLLCGYCNGPGRAAAPAAQGRWPLAGGGAWGYDLTNDQLATAAAEGDLQDRLLWRTLVLAYHQPGGREAYLQLEQRQLGQQMRAEQRLALAQDIAIENAVKFLRGHGRLIAQSFAAQADSPLQAVRAFLAVGQTVTDPRSIDCGVYRALFDLVINDQQTLAVNLQQAQALQALINEHDWQDADMIPEMLGRVWVSQDPQNAELDLQIANQMMAGIHPTDGACYYRRITEWRPLLQAAGERYQLRERMQHCLRLLQRAAPVGSSAARHNLDATIQEYLR